MTKQEFTIRSDQHINTVIKFVPQQNDTIFFMKGEGNKEILNLCDNGDIFVKGNLAENDKEVVNALR